MESPKNKKEKKESLLLVSSRIVLLGLLTLDICTSGYTFFRAISQNFNSFFIIGIDVQNFDPNNLNTKFVIKLLHANIIEEVAFIGLLELLGFFAVFYRNFYMVLSFASAYIMPSTRLVLNVLFVQNTELVYLLFFVFKTITTALSFVFAYLDRPKVYLKNKLADL